MDSNTILQQAQAAAAHGEQVSREKDAYLYLCALDRGDFETVGAILERAQYDPKLEQIINDIHTAEMEDAEEISEEDWQRMREIVRVVLKRYEEGM